MSQKSDDDYYQQLENNDFDSKLNEIQQVLIDYQEWFEACPMMVKDDRFNTSLKKMPWNGSGDTGSQSQKAAYMHIIKLAKLLAHLRGVVPTWHTQDTQGLEYGYGLPTIEEPDRAMQQLVNLARGHALLTGRNYVTIQDLPMIIKVVLSTAPIERVTIFDILLAKNGILTVNEITAFLNVSEPTARRTMTEFKALGLVDAEKKDHLCEDGVMRFTLVMTLKNEFDWFLSKDFNRLSEGFRPREDDNDSSNCNGKDNNDEAMKEISPPPLPPRSTPSDTTTISIMEGNFNEN
ncbi:MAG TPA: DeoR family transcriptional regulator [Nitrososphaeraceae archaeon]